MEDSNWVDDSALTLSILTRRSHKKASECLRIQNSILIVVKDDGSIDKTCEIASRCADHEFPLAE